MQLYSSKSKLTLKLDTLRRVRDHMMPPAVAAVCNRLASHADETMLAWNIWTTRHRENRTASSVHSLRRHKDHIYRTALGACRRRHHHHHHHLFAHKSRLQVKVWPKICGVLWKVQISQKFQMK